MIFEPGPPSHVKSMTTPLCMTSSFFVSTLLKQDGRFLTLQLNCTIKKYLFINVITVFIEWLVKFNWYLYGNKFHQMISIYCKTSWVRVIKNWAYLSLITVLKYEQKCKISSMKDSYSNSKEDWVAFWFQNIYLKI